jgi:transposase
MLPGVSRCAVAQVRQAGHTAGARWGPQLVVPDNISLLFLPPYSPELNPKENLWDEIREKIFKNYALKSIDHVRQKLEEAILYVEHNPDTVKSITSFPYIAKSF